MYLIKKTAPLFLIILLSYFAIRPLFISGFFPMHDSTQVERVFEMKKALNDGMFPVRWVKDLGYGYGYPIFNFYAPLAYYIGGFINLLGFDSLNSTKIMLGLGIVISGIAMYLFAKEFWGQAGGIISGLLYLYAPYHAVNIFVRGDFAEIWAYAFIPLLFFGLYKIFIALTSNSAYDSQISNLKSQISKPQLKNKKIFWSWITIASVAYAAIILSHNLTAMMVTPFIVVYSIVLIITSPKKKFLLLNSYFLILIFGLLLSAFYWIPALAEMKYTNVLSQIGGGADFRDNFVCIQQLWNSPWGFGGSGSGCIDGMSFSIGKLHLILAVFSIIGFVLGKKQKSSQIQIIFFLSSFLIAVFLMLDVSRPFWEAIPQMAFFQYPWRFLIIASFTSSFLGGAVSVLSKSQNDKNIISQGIGAIVVLAILFINTKLFNPQTIINIKSDNLTSATNIKWMTSKISDEYMPQNFTKPGNINEIPGSIFTSGNNKTSIKILENRTKQSSAEITSEQDNTVFINLAYFPAWRVFLDNSEIKYKIFNKGMSVKVPKGKHVLTVKFLETSIERFANILTLSGSFALFLGIITHIRAKYGKKTT